jgi:hypothetical protein
MVHPYLAQQYKQKWKKKDAARFQKNKENRNIQAFCFFLTKPDCFVSLRKFLYFISFKIY